MRWKAQLVVLGLNGRIRRTPGYAGGYLFARWCPECRFPSMPKPARKQGGNLSVTFAIRSIKIHDPAATTINSVSQGKIVG